MDSQVFTIDPVGLDPLGEGNTSAESGPGFVVPNYGAGSGGPLGLWPVWRKPLLPRPKLPPAVLIGTSFILYRPGWLRILSLSGEGPSPATLISQHPLWHPCAGSRRRGISSFLPLQILPSCTQDHPCLVEFGSNEGMRSQPQIFPFLLCQKKKKERVSEREKANHLF